MSHKKKPNYNSMLFSCLSKREKLEGVLSLQYGEWNLGPLKKNVIITTNIVQLCSAAGSVAVDTSVEIALQREPSEQSR